MEKVWLKNYPAGVPAEIDPDKYSSVADIFSEVCKKYPQNPAFQNFDHTITYAQLNKYSSQFATFLQQYLQLKKGERVAIMMPNILQYPIVLFGILQAGLTVVNVNPLYTAPELSHQLKDADVGTIIVLANFAHVLETALPSTSIKNVIVTELGDSLPFIKQKMVNWIVKYIKKVVPRWHIKGAISYKKALKYGQHFKFTPVEIHNSDIAFLQYTGGTTGISKGAMLTHRNIVANMLQARAWINPVLKEGKEIVVTALPLYHIFSLLANCMTFMECGSLSILITNPRDIRAFVRELNKVKFTAITGVNTLFNALVNNKDFAKADFSSLHVSLGGGMAVQKSVAEKWKQLTGEPLIEAYGLTETSPAVTINPLDIKEYNGSIGLPIPSTEISIRDDDGNELGIGQSGELCVRGPQVMLGYWRNPDETARVLSKDGWLKTGDIAMVNQDGFVYLLERKKDMILVSGFNVYPNEIESVIASHPGVLEVGVIGIPDEHSGEAVKAVIVKKDPHLTAEMILEYCKKNLTGYKLPKKIEFRAALPKSNVGKILRKELREENAT